MKRRQLIARLMLVFVLAGSVAATGPVPRKSPDFSFTEPSGIHMRLSAFNGKVVVVEFLLTNCPHCLRIAKMLGKLHEELGPRGFQPVGVAFDPGVNAERATNFSRLMGVPYPIGYTTSDKVDAYLGRALPERFRVPQLVVIDRKGVIRAQSRPIDEKNLEDEIYLRNLIDTLLKEGSGSK
ncbi:MAG TPA: TlpA disulfide reductase family protein [Blastocatellia bacterium]|nr:TlpA disulfide reductase family protein [Blastocatellia bacterium]